MPPKAVEDAWSQTEADSVLYIGGPPRPDKSCAINELSQMAQIMGSELDEQDVTGLDLETDCDCRQWAFQFLRRPIPVTRPTEAATTESTTTSTTTTSTTTSTTTTTTTQTTAASSTTTKAFERPSEDFFDRTEIHFDFGAGKAPFFVIFDSQIL